MIVESENSDPDEGEGAAAAAAAAPAASLVCVHVRTWGFRGRTPQGDRIARDALRCAAHVIKLRGDAETRVFLAADNEFVRAEARRALGARREVVSMPERPAHVAFKRDASDAEIAAALESSVADWHLLSRCPSVIMAWNTGFSRTAAAAAQAPMWIVVDQFAAQGGGEGGDGVPCTEIAGTMREFNKGVGCGW